MIVSNNSLYLQCDRDGCYSTTDDYKTVREAEDEARLLSGWKQTPDGWVCARCVKQESCDPHEWITGEQKLREETTIRPDGSVGLRLDTARRWPVDFPYLDDVWCRKCRTFKHRGSVRGYYPGVPLPKGWPQ